MTAVIYTGTPSISQNLVPSNVTLLERLLVWANTLFYTLNGRKEIFLVDGVPPVLQSTQNVFDGADGIQYVSYTVYLPIDRTWQSDKSKKFWEWAIEVTSAVGPTTFNDSPYP